MTARVFALSALVALLVGGGLSLTFVFDNRTPIATAMGVISVMLFLSLRFVFLMTMKSTITATFVLVYLILLGVFGFFTGIGAGEEIGPITNTLITNFTVLMSVVIASYFGSTAYQAVAEIKSTAGNPEAAEAISRAREDDRDALEAASVRTSASSPLRRRPTRAARRSAPSSE